MDVKHITGLSKTGSQNSEILQTSTTFKGTEFFYPLSTPSVRDVSPSVSLLLIFVLSVAIVTLVPSSFYILYDILHRSIDVQILRIFPGHEQQ